MKNKLLVFGSCYSHGLELWEEANIKNYKDMDQLMAALRSNAFEYWEAFHNDTRDRRQNLKERIDFNRSNSWPMYLNDYDVTNYSAVGQRNLENYLKLISMLENNEIDSNSKIIIEITQPGGAKMVSSEGTIKTIIVDEAEYFCRDRDIANNIKMSYNNFETDRFNAWNDLLVLELLFFKLKERGIKYKYFFYNKAEWYDILRSTPFNLYTDIDLPFEDSFNKTLTKIINESLLTNEDDITISQFEKLPQGHLSLKGHRQFGEFIKSKLKDF